MLVDGQKVQDNSVFTFDLCIIGAGAAGITIARRFNGASKKVGLIESGGFEYSAEVSKLSEGETSGVRDNYLTQTRMRMFGGTTNHWAGTCLPLDVSDFEKKELANQ
jgi:choline dehydrogenase-like flavoprotein